MRSDCAGLGWSIRWDELIGWPLISTWLSLCHLGRPLQSVQGWWEIYQNIISLPARRLWQADLHQILTCTARSHIQLASAQNEEHNYCIIFVKQRVKVLRAARMAGILSLLCGVAAVESRSFLTRPGGSGRHSKLRRKPECILPALDRHECPDIPPTAATRNPTRSCLKLSNSPPASPPSADLYKHMKMGSDLSTKRGTPRRGFVVQHW